MQGNKQWRQNNKNDYDDGQKLDAITAISSSFQLQSTFLPTGEVGRTLVSHIGIPAS